MRPAVGDTPPAPGRPHRKRKLQNAELKQYIIRTVKNHRPTAATHTASKRQTTKVPAAPTSMHTRSSHGPVCARPSRYYTGAGRGNYRTVPRTRRISSVRDIPDNVTCDCYQRHLSACANTRYFQNQERAARISILFLTYN